MYRQKMEELISWKNLKTDKKPLIIKGAKQVGKTWLMLEFGKKYEQYSYINLKEDNNIVELFSERLDLNKIIQVLKIKTGVNIEPKNTLIIFDEIQDNLEILKYFCENTTQYDIIFASNSLNMDIERENFVEVELYPLNFYEFLRALGENDLLELIKNKEFELLNIFQNKLEDYLRQYLFVGGMPEVVDDYIKNKDFEKVRNKQFEILKLYENQFQKDVSNINYKKVMQLIVTIPKQLKNNGKRFKYKMLTKSAKARDYKIALNYLIKKGLVYKIYKIEKNNSFRLYLLDVRIIMCHVKNRF